MPRHHTKLLLQLKRLTPTRQLQPATVAMGSTTTISSSSNSSSMHTLATRPRDSRTAMARISSSSRTPAAVHSHTSRRQRNHTAMHSLLHISQRARMLVPNPTRGRSCALTMASRTTTMHPLVSHSGSSLRALCDLSASEAEGGGQSQPLESINGWSHHVKVYGTLCWPTGMPAVCVEVDVFSFHGTGRLRSVPCLACPQKAWQANVSMCQGCFSAGMQVIIA